MAYNPFGEETDVEDFSNRQETEEQRKKRLARMATLMTGQVGLGDMAGQMLGERIAPIQQAVTNPQAALEQRFGVPVEQTQPVAPVAPTVQQPQQVQQQPVAETQVAPVAPVQPEQVQQPSMVEKPAMPVAPVNPAVQEVTQTQLPQAGEGVQVAGPAQLPQKAEVKQSTLDDIYHNTFVEASNTKDPKQRQAAFAALIANPKVPEGIKTQANMAFVQDYQNERAKQEAIQKLEKATPNDLARFMQEKSKDEGSYLKAILFHRLGLNELAQQEQEKLSPSLKAESIIASDGTRYTGYRNKQGEVVKAFNSEGQIANQDEVAKLSAAALPTKAHLLPSAHGGLVQRTNPQTGNVETGVLFQDPQRGNKTYVKVGNQEYDTTGWTSMAQNVQAISAAAGAKVTGEAGAKGFDVNQPGATGATGIAQSLGIPVISGTRAPDKQAALYQQSVDAGTPGVLPNGNPVAKPGTSSHETGNAIDVDSSKLTADQRKQLAVNGFRQPLPKTDPNHWEYDASTANKKSPLYVQQARAEAAAAAQKKEAEVIAEAKGKEGAAVIKKQAFADNAYPIVKELGAIIKESTGSGLGASVDSLAAQIGTSPKGAQAIAKLEVFASPLVSMVPRFEGSQSDRDVAMYQKQAGDFANPKLPIATRLAALQGMVKLLQIYDKEGANDWGAISGQQEKTINGITYVFDGKGWKKK